MKWFNWGNNKIFWIVESLTIKAAIICGVHHWGYVEELNKEKKKTGVVKKKEMVSFF
jgi:hypothetical protein